MNESIYKYFNVGTILWMSYPPATYGQSVEGYKDSLLKVLKDDYFNAIEITQIKDDGLREEVKQLLGQSHVKICYGAQPRLLSTGLNPNDLDEEGRLKAEKTLIEGINEAEYLGAKGIAFLAGKWQEETREQAYQQLYKTTVHICKYAESKGMYVNLEVFDYDVDKAALIGPAPLAARFAADVRCQCSNFGLLVDLSHFPTTYETSKFVIQTLRPYPRLGYPNSANDVPQLLDYLKVLQQEGFFREDDPLVLSMEVSPRPGEDPDIVLANTKRALNRAWALL